MKHALSALALAALAGASAPTLAAMAPLASAQIDWTTFKVELFDLDPDDAISPSLSFTNHSSGAWANLGEDWSSDLARDWTTPISATRGPFTASAEGDGLEAAAYGGPGSGSVERGAIFTLSPMTRAEFSVYGSAEIQPGLGYHASSFGISTWGIGLSDQNSSGSIVAYAWILPAAASGVVNASFLNLTGAPLDGYMNAGIYFTTPVPEAYALMLPGLGLVVWMARHRKRQSA
jgi:hypothetical protein